MRRLQSSCGHRRFLRHSRRRLLAVVTCGVLGSVVARGAVAQTLTRTYQQTGHSEQLTSVAASADGLRFLTTSVDGTARLWQGVAPRHILCPGPTSPVIGGDLSPDGLVAVYADLEGGLYRYGVDDQSLVVIGAVAEGPVRALRFSEDGSLISSIGDNGAMVRSAADLTAVASLVGGEEVSALDVAAATVSVTARGSQVEVWNAATGAVLLSWTASGAIRDLATSDSAGTIAALVDGVEVVVRDVASGSSVATIADTMGLFTTVELSNDGSLLTIGDRVGRLHFFATATGQFITSLSAHADELIETRMVGTSPFLVTASYDSTSQLAFLPVPSIAGAVSPATGRTWSGGVSWSGRAVLTGSLSRIDIVDATSAVPHAPIPVPDLSSSPLTSQSGRPVDRSLLTAAAIARVGNEVVGGGMDGFLKVWDGDGDLMRSEQVSATGVMSVAISPDGSRAFAGTVEGDLVALDVSTGTRLWTRSFGAGRVLERLAVSHDGGLLAVVDGSDSVEVLNATTGATSSTLVSVGSLVRHAEFLEDGSKLVICGEDGVVGLWPLAASTADWVGGWSLVPAVCSCVIPGGRKVLFLSEDGQVGCLDLDSLSATPVAVGLPVPGAHEIGFAGGEIVILGMHGEISVFSPAGL